MRFTGPQCPQESVTDGYAIRNLPQVGAEMHLHAWACGTEPCRAVAGVYRETALGWKIQVG